ncbi:MAG: hypothetical protein IKO35_03390, partial [Elusimicrobiaceae bacterium]|nr:hypothetical protein [Elusimicrobiaceae bacterium]
PHLQTLFNEVGALNDRRLEVRVIKRLQYLALNKINLIEKLFPESSYETLSSKTTRLRYLKNLNQLTAENFQEDQLVLSIEKQMSLNPKHDFPIRHVSGQAMVEVGNKYYPVYQHDISLNFMGNLYRFLLSGTKRHEPITVVFDSEGESLALFNKNKKLWLRITSHEYAVPNRLHVHLNELRTVEFINTYGVEKTEQVNLNLSIPLQAPAHLPKHQIKKYLYQLLIENPVKHFQGDAHATVEKHAIF